MEDGELVEHPVWGVGVLGQEEGGKRKVVIWDASHSRPETKLVMVNFINAKCRPATQPLSEGNARLLAKILCADHNILSRAVLGIEIFVQSIKATRLDPLLERLRAMVGPDILREETEGATLDPEGRLAAEMLTWSLDRESTGSALLDAEHEADLNARFAKVAKRHPYRRVMLLSERVKCAHCHERLRRSQEVREWKSCPHCSARTIDGLYDIRNEHVYLPFPRGFGTTWARPGDGRQSWCEHCREWSFKPEDPWGPLPRASVLLCSQIKA